MSTILPGWYKDPADPTTQRWWDGEGWLGEPLPADITPPEGPPAVTVAAPTPEPPATPAPGPAPSAVWPQTGTGPVVTPGPTAGPASTAGHAPGAPVPWPMSHRYPMAVPRPHGFLLAGVGARFMARLVDGLAVLVLAAVANIWFAIEFWRAFEPLIPWALSGPATVETVPASAERAVELMIVMGVVLTAVWFAYEVPASANSGQTLGKRIFGIKVMREETDGRLGFGRSFWRWFRLAWPTPFWVACYGLPILLQVIDCLYILMDRRQRQALHDRISRTLVVQVPRANRPETARTPVGPAAEPGAERADNSSDARGAESTSTFSDARGAESTSTFSDARGAESTIGESHADSR